MPGNGALSNWSEAVNVLRVAVFKASNVGCRDGLRMLKTYVSKISGGIHIHKFQLVFCAPGSSTGSCHCRVSFAAQGSCLFMEDQ